MRTARISSKGRSSPVWLVIGCFLVTILLLMVSSFDTSSEKTAGLISILAILFLSLTPFFRRHLKQSCSALFLLVLGYTVLSGLSTLYGYAPSVALPEFCKVLFGFLVFLLVWELKDRFGTRSLIYGFAGISSVLSWICVDQASIRWIGRLVYAILTAWIPNYVGTEAGYNRNRLWGLFGNANTMAFLCGIAVFLTLYLLLTASTHKKRILPLIMLFLNAFTFLMCVSLGATLCMGFTVLLCLIFAGKENRISFLYIGVETLLTVLAAILASYRFFGTDSGFWVLPIVILAAGILILLDLKLRDRTVALLTAHRKVFGITLVILLVLCIGFSVLALSLTKSATVEAGGVSTSYFLYPDSSECTVELQTEGSGQVGVYVNTHEDILVGRDNLFYTGEISDSIPLELPEDTAEVKLIFYAADTPLTIHSISYTDGSGSHEIAPAYRLLPENIVSRLRNLPSNSSVVQRIMLMEDGVTLWKTAPVFGRGLGGFNSGLTSVQDFFFESQYAHNHLVQALCDLGIVGLLLYLGIFAAGFKVLWGLRRSETEQPLYLALFGALVLAFTHNALEINLSVGEGIFANLVVFGLLASNAKPFASKRLVAALKVVVWIVPAYFLVFTLLIAGNFAAASKMAHSTYLDDLESAAKMDVFEGSNYLLTFIENAPLTEDAGYIERAENHAEKLAKSHLSFAPSVLSKFYYDIGQADKGAEMAALYLERNRSNPEGWNTMFHTFDTVLDAALSGQSGLDAAQCLEQFRSFYDDLLQRNQEMLDSVVLDARGTAFVSRLLTVDSTADSTEQISTAMWNQLFDWNTVPDLDDNGLPDNMTVDNYFVRQEDGALEAPNGLNATITVTPKATGTYLITARCNDAALFQFTSDVIQVLQAEGDTYLCLINVPAELQNTPFDLSFSLGTGCILQNLQIVSLTE